MILVGILLFYLGFASAAQSDWPQKFHDAGRTNLGEGDTAMTGIWFLPTLNQLFTLPTTLFQTQPLVAKTGLLFTFGADNTIVCSDITNGKQTIVYKVLPGPVNNSFQPATIALNADQSQVYALYDWQGFGFILLAVNTISGATDWWTFQANTIHKDFVYLQPSPVIPLGLIAIPQVNCTDFFVPPSTPRNNQVNYLSRVIGRHPYAPLSAPLATTSSLHLHFMEDGKPTYAVATSNGGILAQTPVPQGYPLVMVTPEIGAAVFTTPDDAIQTEVMVIYWDKDTNTLTPQQQENLKNPTYADGFFVFVSNNNGMAWLEFHPESNFANRVVWTAPLDFSYSQKVHMSQNGAIPKELLYVHSGTKLAAYNFGGYKQWEISLAADPVIAPVSASRKQAGRNLHFVLVSSGNTIHELTCCSGNGLCTMENVQSQQCVCDTNYMTVPNNNGLQCNVFCDPNQCKGTCQPNAAKPCLCPVDTFGINCDINCNAATNCSGRGTCDAVGACLCSNTTNFITYSGPHCSTSTPNWLLIGCVAGGGLVVVLVIVIGVVLCQSKKNQNKYSELVQQ